MKVVAHNPCAAGAFARLPLMLSVMQELLDAGHEVVDVICDGAAPACVISLETQEAICSFCHKRALRGAALVRGDLRVVDLSDFVSVQLEFGLRVTTDRFADLAELKAIHYKGVDIGYAALSSYAHVTRDPDPDLADPRVRTTLQHLLTTGKLVYEAWTNLLAQEHPDRVVMFNGRLAIDRPVLRLCQQRGIECHVYEITAGVDGVARFDNALPHDIDYLVREIRATWDAAGDDRGEVASAFYAMRRAGAAVGQAAGQSIRTNEVSYVGRQVGGWLPEGWRPDAHNVVLFGSSDDEFGAIAPEWEVAVYPSQLEAVHQLGRSLAGSDTRVYFRMHPRLVGMDRPFVHAMRALMGRYPNVIVVPPESPVSSYALLDAAAVVMTFRSTLTMEAIFAGKPCVTLANSYYRQLGGSYAPTSHAEVLALLRAPSPGRNLPAPKNPLPALQFGYWRMRAGRTQVHYAGDKTRGSRRGYTFKGDSIDVGGLAKLRYRLARWRQKRAWA